ncbi:MAG: hypothetical protein K8H88_16700 [Sandaracinaceae bacterium]|nr:hypothetical protein [Sandaracinaceae bacterium]
MMSARARRIAVWVWGLVLSCLVYAPALYKWDQSGWGDWQQFHHWWEVGRVSILRWGEIPLWDPHHCGGVSMWGQPQAQLYAPTWWITGLPFGTVAGHKLFVILHHVVGYAGAYFLARRHYRQTAAGATVVAITWALSGFFAWRGAGGHSTFLAFHYIPWIYWSWRRANTDVRFTIPVAALMALQLLEGGTYPFPLTSLLLVVDALLQVVLGHVPLALRALLSLDLDLAKTAIRKFARLLRTALIAGPLALVLGSVRLIPVYLTMREYPRRTTLDDSQSLRDLLESLTGREPHAWIWGHRWAWAEYGSFMGWAALVLAGCGAMLAIARRRHAGLIVMAALFGAIAMGNHGPEWPWPRLHELPLFSNFHVEARFHVLMTFALAILAGLAVSEFDLRMKLEVPHLGTRAFFAALVWMLVAAIAAEVISNDLRITGPRWDGQPIVAEEVEHPHLVSEVGYLDNYARYPQQNVGTIACYDPVPWHIPRSLWVGDVPQVRIEVPGAGRLLAEGRTNHTSWAHVYLRAPARLIFNQRYDADWVTSAGVVADDRGRLAVDLPAGEHRVVARYAPSDLPWSLVIPGLGALFCMLLLWRHGRARARATRSTPRS